MSTLADLVFATGLELDIQIRPQRRPIDRLTGPIGRRVRARRRQLVKTAALHGLTDLRVFGSVARGEEHDDSDLDLLVDIPEGMGLLALGRARQELERVVGTTVDLVSSDGLKPDVAAHIEQDLVPL